MPKPLPPPLCCMKRFNTGTEQEVTSSIRPGGCLTSPRNAALADVQIQVAFAQQCIQDLRLKASAGETFVTLQFANLISIGWSMSRWCDPWTRSASNLEVLHRHSLLSSKTLRRLFSDPTLRFVQRWRAREHRDLHLPVCVRVRKMLRNF